MNFEHVFKLFMKIVLWHSFESRKKLLKENDKASKIFGKLWICSIIIYFFNIFILEMAALLLPANEEILKNVRKELNEELDRFENNVKILEDWMNCQPHLPKNYDRRMLPIFLRGSKHDMEKAKYKLEMYFIGKTLIPTLFCNRDPERKDISATLDYLDLCVIPKLTPEGYRITINKVKTNDVKDFNIELLLLRGTFITCLRTVVETPYAGDVIIYDANNLTTAHIGCFLTPFVRKCLSLGPECYPNRLKMLHIINVHPVVDTLVTLLKPLVKEKFRKRFILHKSLEALKEHFPDDCLPNDFGGTAGSLDSLSKATYEYCVRNKDWFMEQENVKLLGPVPEKYIVDDGFGVEGSFRKLSVD